MSKKKTFKAVEFSLALTGMPTLSDVCRSFLNVLEV